MKKHIRSIALAAGLLAGNGAYATGIPVIDAANLAQATQQVASWAQQLQQMAYQLQQLKQTYDSLSGIRGMAGLANNPALRKYLPSDWQQTLSLANGAASGQYNSLSGSLGAMKSATRIMGIEDTGLSSTSYAGKAYQNSQNQAALNRVLAEESYRQASQRIDGLQTMLDKVNDAPDEKDILDLQARIQAEEALLQNEQIKLASLAQLQQAQRDIASQQAAEIRMQSAKGGLPEGW